MENTTRGIVSRISGLIVTVLLALGINYLWQPAWSFRSDSMWWYLLVITIVGGFIQFLVEQIFCEDYYIGTLIGGAAAILIVLILIIGGLTSWSLFSASKYQQLTTIEEGNFEEDVNHVQNVNNISIVDWGTAKRLGDRTIGSISNAAWYEVDNEYDLINYQGEQYRISPLSYGGLFKFGKAKHDGIPGYVLVNTQTQEAKYVELEEGLKYSPSAYWSYDLNRHLRGQYGSYIFGEFKFEIDDEGNPYWITAVNTPTIGMFGGKKQGTFIITNACTGESQEYKTEELPEWVDQAYDLSYLMKMAEYNLKFINGFWNAMFAKTNVLNTSYKYSLNYYNTTITANGDVVFYTGLTPESNAETNVGFILANPRTGVIKRYTCSGAEETSAQASAESLVQNYDYTATFPTILNVEGEETYFMLLKDKAGLVQRYSLCNIKNYTIVVEATTLEDAVNQYLVKLGKANPEHDAVETLKVEGKIQELYEAQIDGCTFYYFTIEGSTNLYMSSIKNSNKQVLLKVGTTVSIEYVNSSEEGIYIVQKIAF